MISEDLFSEFFDVKQIQDHHSPQKKLEHVQSELGVSLFPMLSPAPWQKIKEGESLVSISWQVATLSVVEIWCCTWEVYSAS